MAVKRTSFHFPRAAMEQLYAIMKLSYLKNGADVIRAALHSYDDILYLDEKGYKIVVRDKGGSEALYPPYSTFVHPTIEDALTLNDSDLEKMKAIPRNFFFAGEAVDRLESIKARSFVKSNADAIRVALTTYAELLAVNSIGEEILVRDRDGAETIYSPHRPWPRAVEHSGPSRPDVMEAAKERTLEYI